MAKIPKKQFTLLAAGLLLFVLSLAITAKVSYYFGERHISELVLHSDIPGAKQAYAPANYAEVIEKLRAERDRLSNDYNSACYNYQALYDAYEALYTKAGATAGHEKIVRPDSARGNEESCYR